MRISKKILAIALSILMAVSMMPFTVFASESTTTWDISSVPGTVLDYNSSCTVGDVTITSSGAATIYGMMSNKDICAYDSNGELTFSTDAGNFTQIKIDVQRVDYGTMDDTNWVLENGACVWTGNSNEVVFNLSANLDLVSTYIEFTIDAPAEPTKPTATVSEVPIATVEQYFPGSDLDVAYKFVANNDGDDIYKTYNADFTVSFDKAIPQGSVRLFGQYGNYPLTECPITKDLAANEEYRLLRDAMGMDMTYQQILDQVQTFYCGAQFTSASAGAKMTVKLAIYETQEVSGVPVETGTVVEIDDAEQTFTAPELPQAVVTDITNTAENEKDLDIALKFEAPAGVTAYDDEYCDFVVTFDKAITSNDIEFWGNYGTYGWVNLNSEASGDAVTFEANKPYYLLRDVVKWPMTYAQIRDNVGTFKCGIKCHIGAAGTTTSVQLALFDEPAAGEEPVIAEVGDVEEYTAPALPQATVTDITDTAENELGLDAAYKFEAPAGATTAYDNEYCDFAVTFDKTVTSDEMMLFGKYGAYDWTNIASEASGNSVVYEAGKTYYLLRDIIKWPMTYGQIREIGTFLCGVSSTYAANGVKMDVDLVLFEEPAPGEEPAPVVLDDEDFTAPDKPAPAPQDEVSITTADEIDVNLYLANTGEEVTVEYTFNTTPDFETDVQETKTVNFTSLPEVGGKRVLTIRVAPAQIKDNIDVVIKNAAGETIRSYENYSVAAYCDELIAGDFDESIKTLAKAVLDYGKAASKFFGYNTSAFANQQNYFGDYTFDTTAMTAEVDGIDISGVRYVATSTPSLRFVVENMTEGDAARYEVTTDKGYNADFVMVEGKLLLQVTGIQAAKLGETITITVTNPSSQSTIATVKYTPLAYAYKASIANNAELQRLGNTIGTYSAAAKAVFA